jgi:hypothetical protein
LFFFFLRQLPRLIIISLPSYLINFINISSHFLFTQRSTGRIPNHRVFFLRQFLSSIQRLIIEILLAKSFIFRMIIKSSRILTLNSFYIIFSFLHINKAILTKYILIAFRSFYIYRVFLLDKLKRWFVKGLFFRLSNIFLNFSLSNHI